VNRRLILWLLCGLLQLPANAHVGSPTVFFEGQAGPYPVHVVIRPAEVIPGLAQISVRIDGRKVDRVTALPIKWNAGRKGAPLPDVAQPVRGETNLYSAELWFMEGGAQSVEVEVTGTSGTGRVTIPVDAVARRVLTMPRGLGAALLVLGLLLTILLLGIIGAAIRESVVEPGSQVSRRRQWSARVAIALSALLFALLLYGGKNWWDAEAADYRNNRLYRPMEAAAQVRVENGNPILRLEISDPKFARSPPLVPDHGKLMHLFLMRIPELDAFAHLHPMKLDRKTFESKLPDLPPGSYQLYADVTYETGLADTLTAVVQVPAPSSAATLSQASGDEDDSWRMASPLDGNRQVGDCRLARDYKMTWLGQREVVANQPVTLRFDVHNAHGKPVILEPYLGMRGHLALRRADGAVFTHLHPGGSASMAAMQLSVLRTEGKLPLKAAFGADEPICQVPEVGPGENRWLQGKASAETSTVSFPYAFPKPGPYRLWVQVKVSGEVMTGVFDVTVRVNQ
jgi:hypothetical protein